MGLSKHIESKDGFSCSSLSFSHAVDMKGSESSTTESAANPVGTIGWQAPEMMQRQRKMLSQHDSISDRNIFDECTILGESSGSLTSRLQTVDIFSLGCVFHYVLFPGEHPFGEWFEREANIMNGSLDLEHLKLVPDLHDLLSRMLANDPSRRPSAVEVSAHPFFWTSAKRLDFLVSISDRLEREPSNSSVMVLLESKAAAVVGRHWDRKLHPSFLEDLGKYRKYDTSSVRDCLRVVRNKKHHFLELSEELKALMSPIPNGFLLYFEKRFPRLLLHVISIAATHLAEEKEFQEYLGAAIPLFVSHDRDESMMTSEGLSALRSEPRDDVSYSDGILWSGSSLSEAQSVRGWWKSGTAWDTSFTSMHYKSRARPGHLVKSYTDWKYRSRLCTHWEQTKATTCPMRKKGKCDFAHGKIQYLKTPL